MLIGWLVLAFGFVMALILLCKLPIDQVSPDVLDDSPVVKFKKLHPNASIPKYAKPGDAGADLKSTVNTEIFPGEWKFIGCGFSMELPPGWEAQVRSRSGLAAKNGIKVLNSPGTVDSGYRGEVGVILMNHGPKMEIKAGDRIAQMVIAKAPQATFIEVEELSSTERGTGGFGSTGVGG